MAPTRLKTGVLKVVFAFVLAMPLDGHADQPTDGATRLEIALEICNNIEATKTDWKAYFSFYERECRDMIQNSDPPGIHTTIRTHAHVVAAAQQLRNGRSKEQIKDTLIKSIKSTRTQQEKEIMSAGSLLLAARLVSMMNIGPLPYGIFQRRHIPWSDGIPTLQGLIEEHYTNSLPQSNSKLRFRGNFIAFNVQQFTQLKIIWTNNLADHLHILDEDKHLCIFHHDTFLRHQKSDIFPADLLNETLRTLDLLFPLRSTENDKSIKWLEKEVLENNLDPGLRDHRDPTVTEDRRADKYKFWGERLSILHEEFNDPHVSSIRQFWHDTRNKPQWYTFWVAMLILLLTVLFGFIQSIEGALQVYKAYHPS